MTFFLYCWIPWGKDRDVIISGQKTLSIAAEVCGVVSQASWPSSGVYSVFPLSRFPSGHVTPCQAAPAEYIWGANEKGSFVKTRKRAPLPLLLLWEKKKVGGKSAWSILLTWLTFTQTINIYRKHSPSHYLSHLHLNLQPHHQQLFFFFLFFFLLLLNKGKFNRQVAN